MLKVILAAVAAAALIATVALVDAAHGLKQRRKSGRPVTPPPPQACVQQPEKPWRPLTEGSPATIFKLIEFERDHHLYPLKTFSTTAKNPKSISQSCLRYDVANTGRVDITRLIWPVAGLKLERLRPADPRSKRLNDVTGQIVKDRSTVYAFERAEAVTENWAEFQKKRGEAEPTGSSGIAERDEQDPILAIPGLYELSKQRRVDVFPASALDLAANEPIDVIEQSYGGSKFSLLITSSAVRNGRDIVIKTTVKTSGAGARDVRYTMPALRALAEIRPRDASPENYRAFLEEFSSAKYKLAYRGVGEWEFTLSSIWPATRVIYKMQHPIGLLKDGELECVMVSSYSLLALSFDLRQCPEHNSLIWAKRGRDASQLHRRDGRSGLATHAPRR